MTLLERLAALAAEERRALVERDLPALVRCNEEKQTLAEALVQARGTSSEALSALRQAFSHNASLARWLSSQISSRLGRAGMATHYDRSAQAQTERLNLLNRTL